ncbi:hypothetical protein PYDG_00059 [Pseudoalteromonas phage pYD6-A]|uniref:Uncharacterized protein n=1 Tax=Pseudoalteromonas phage pYD6-A TaxID=754052 RepID=M4T3Y6_9CAUD|nr:hypothetical protein PYDG_00059 [Pseudoalteromonas phage pYD6-A]AGH57589.1 hypothetical protein PYDG_00059 [Pseudoalteromonas phage pYD6-A]
MSKQPTKKPSIYAGLPSLSNSPKLNKTGFTGGSLANMNDFVTRRVNANTLSGTESNIWAYHDDHEYERNLPNWMHLNALANELGESFAILAPTKYKEWLECKAIIGFRQTNKLLGSNND